MELATSLKGQTVRNSVREVGINANHWYPVSWANMLKAGQIKPVMVWNQAIALYRDTDGHAHALEDACPHKGVALHNGEVHGEHLVCPYHGWEFGTDGQCVSIPYFPKGQKLPCAQARSYPVREEYGIIWVFPGDSALAETAPFPQISEYDDPRWTAIPITGHFKAHFSICNENTMDVFHGFLHKDLQGWFDPVLLSLKETDGSVCAQYRVNYQGWMSKFLGLSTEANGVTTRTVTVDYRYPHYHSSLEGISSLHLMRLPVGPRETRSFSLLFLRLPLPRWLLDWIKPVLVPFILNFVFMKFLNQDVAMMESEQRTYDANRDRRYVEINPAIIALQRLVVRQYEQFMQQSSQLQSNRAGDFQGDIPLPRAIISNQVESASDSSIN
ncbi:MAG TPA: aromatic ring-hydroxylating dioxygenase subunit alpha [Crinalium sp.]|jgi:phenylpropionate dioxygenase-like ring-hydroxylating dioxygenase large terminal subunit